jgi:hypothetical protein
MRDNRMFGGESHGTRVEPVTDKLLPERAQSLPATVRRLPSWAACRRTNTHARTATSGHQT